MRTNLLIYMYLFVLHAFHCREQGYSEEKGRPQSHHHDTKRKLLVSIVDFITVYYLVYLSFFFERVIHGLCKYQPF